MTIDDGEETENEELGNAHGEPVSQMNIKSESDHLDVNCFVALLLFPRQHSRCKTN